MKFSDVIFYKGTEHLDAGERGKCAALHYAYIGIMLLLMGICVGLVSLFVCSAYLGNNDWEMFLSYLDEPLLLLLNILPCVLLVAVFYFATGRAWAAFTFPTLIVYILSLVGYYKMRLRDDVLVASDFRLTGEAARIAHRYTFEITGRVQLIILSLIFGVVFAVVLMRGTLKNKLVRIIGTALSVLALAILIPTVYLSPKVYASATNSGDNYNKWSDIQVFVSKGFIYPLLYSVRDAIPQPPAGYSADAAESILARYTPEDTSDDAKVNLIVVMFEAYTDLSEHPEIPVYDEVYAPLHALEAESLSGHLVPNVFAGGTNDTEWTFLTGYAENEDYRGSTNSFAHELRSRGYHTEGFHPGVGWFYNRGNVMKYLGMEDYYFLDDYNTEDRTDEFFFSTVRDLYDARDKSVPYFSYNGTFQNHGPYASESTGEKAYLARDGMSDSTYNILNNYFSGIADTTQRMYDFVDSFRDDPEPVVIVFFGDHMPWLGDGKSVCKELGINIDQSTEEGFFNYYRTPYIIWANDAAKEATGGDFAGEGDNISACFLMDRVFEECGWGKSAFMQLNHDLSEVTTVMNTGAHCYYIDGTLTKEPEGEAAELIQDYNIVEYYMKNKFLY